MPSPPLTDPDVRISRIRFLLWQVRTGKPRLTVASRPLGTAAAHRGWRSSVAIRPCCVDTDSGCGVPGVFPFDGSTSRLSPSLPWVLRGGVSQVQQYYETLRLPRTQTGRLMDSSLGSSPSPRLRSVRYESTSCRLAPGFTVRRRETGSVGREYRDLTGSWDAPPVPMPCSLTPAGPPHPTNSVFRCCPRSQYDEGSRDEQFRGSITRRQHRLSTLHGGHRCPSCKTRLRRVVSLYREGVEPSGHQQGFRSRTIHEHPPFQAYPVAHWLCFARLVHPTLVVTLGGVSVAWA